MSLGKKDIVKIISSKAHFSLSESSELLESFISFIKNNKKNKTKISNFGTFCTHISPERIGRNPKTKEEFKIEQRSKLKFSPSSKLRSLLN